MKWLGEFLIPQIDSFQITNFMSLITHFPQVNFLITKKWESESKKLFLPWFRDMRNCQVFLLQKTWAVVQHVGELLHEQQKLGSFMVLPIWAGLWIEVRDNSSLQYQLAQIQ